MQENIKKHWLNLIGSSQRPSAPVPQKRKSGLIIKSLKKRRRRKKEKEALLTDEEHEETSEEEEIEEAPVDSIASSSDSESISEVSNFLALN